MPTKIAEDQLAAQLELARRLLLMEQQLDAYQKLYDEEMDQMRRTLAEYRKKLLAILPAGESTVPEADLVES